MLAQPFREQGSTIFLALTLPHVNSSSPPTTHQAVNERPSNYNTHIPGLGVKFPFLPRFLLDLFRAISIDNITLL